MTQKDAIKLFEERKIRTVWDEDQEKWYFSVVDIVSVLTDSALNWDCSWGQIVPR